MPNQLIQILALVPTQLALTLSGLLFLGILALVARNADEQNFKRCTFWFIVGLAAAHVLGLVDLQLLVADHWRALTMTAGVYFALGFPWVYLYEWERFLTREYARRLAVLKSLPTDEAENHAYNRPVKAREHKRKILGWMVWWPMMLMYAVLIRWLLNIADHLVKLWKYFFECVVHLFQEKSNRRFSALMKKPHS